LGLKPYWCLNKMGSKNDNNVLYIIFSNILEIAGSKLTGL